MFMGGRMLKAAACSGRIRCRGPAHWRSLNQFLKGVPPAPIPLEEIFEVSRITLDVAEHLRG